MPRRYRWSEKSAASRGYDWAHAKRRRALLAAEPLCRLCDAKGISRIAEIADHIIPLAHGGSNEMSNYRPLCRECHTEVTLIASGHPPRRKQTIGLDGWPTSDP